MPYSKIPMKDTLTSVLFFCPLRRGFFPGPRLASRRMVQMTVFHAHQLPPE